MKYFNKTKKELVLPTLTHTIMCRKIKINPAKDNFFFPALIVPKNDILGNRRL